MLVSYGEHIDPQAAAILPVFTYKKQVGLYIEHKQINTDPALQKFLEIVIYVFTLNSD